MTTVHNTVLQAFTEVIWILFA